MDKRVLLVVIIFCILSLLSLSCFTPSPSPPQEPEVCTPCGVNFDKEIIGRSTWTFLHSLVQNYPESPTRQDQEAMTNLFQFVRWYPCYICRSHFQKYIDDFPPDVTCKTRLVVWLCEAHNAVNRRLGKPEFDCRQTQEE